MNIASISSELPKVLFLLRSLKRRRLGIKQLEVIYNSIVVSRISYAVSAWGGWVCSHDKNQFDAIMKKAHKYGYTTEIRSFNDIRQKADLSLIRKMQSDRHCLHHLLPPIKQKELVERTRQREHDFILPSLRTELAKNVFPTRILFNYIESNES